MIPSGLTSSVINRASLGDGYVRVRDSGLVAAVAQFLYDEAALLDQWHLDEQNASRLLRNKAHYDPNCLFSATSRPYWPILLR
jgi:hypothetical protein